MTEVCKFEKGLEGEAYVAEVIRAAAALVGKPIRLFNHIILDFDSIYGSRTVELDHVIVTGNRIIIGETKNGTYVRTCYEEVPWMHLNNDYSDNPIIQNHYHKQVFCSLFDIDREKVMTVELLLQYSNCKRKTQFPNDNVFGADSLFDGLCMLLADNNSEKNAYDEICNRLEKIEKRSIGREEEHKKNLREIREIEEKTRTRDKYYKFKRTDNAICPLCGGELVFRYGSWKKYKIGNVNKTQNIALGCKNYASMNCKTFIEPKKDGGTGFDDIDAIHIEDRNGWTMNERHVRTVLDEYYDLKDQVENIQSTLKRVEQDNQVKANLISRLKDENNELRKEAENAEQECKRFKRFFGRLYLKE